MFHLNRTAAKDQEQNKFTSGTGYVEPNMRNRAGRPKPWRRIFVMPPAGRALGGPITYSGPRAGWDFDGGGRGLRRTAGKLLLQPGFALCSPVLMGVPTASRTLVETSVPRVRRAAGGKTAGTTTEPQRH